LDLPLRTFIEQISQLKPVFNKPLIEIIDEKQALAPVSFNLDKKSLQIAQRLIALILKGKYRYDKSGEAIDIDDDTSVRLSFASSGQQESLWILMSLFSLILSKIKSFVIIEEPEAHLFPESQKFMTDLMSLIANINENQIMITTHSPYILTSLNNHIYAEQVGRNYQEQVSQIVDPSFWMSHQRVNACYVDAGMIRSIMDEELHLIKAEEIDSASQLINNEFSKLADIE
jgi:AAA15 family ATPase/GTPase